MTVCSLVPCEDLLSRKEIAGGGSYMPNYSSPKSQQRSPTSTLYQTSEDTGDVCPSPHFLALSGMEIHR